MKRIFVSCLLLLGILETAFAQGIAFENGTWAEALAKAEQENKLFFVDCFTSWCGPCKRMAKDIFTREKVRQYYNERFICYQQDLEKGNGPEIKKRYGVEAYPTFLFLNGKGKLVFKLVGYQDVRDLLRETEKVEIYDRYGGWGKVETDRQSGKIGADFWKDYYELAGDEEQPEVLKNWLKAMPDQELFVATTGTLVGRVIYDYDLFLRIAQGIVRLENQDIDFSIVYTYPFKEKVADLLEKSIGEGNEKRFQELLKLKKILLKLPDIPRREIDVTKGESFLAVSPEFLQLCYEQQNKTNDKDFKQLLPFYMEQLMKAEPLDSITRELNQKLECVSGSRKEAIPEVLKKVMQKLEKEKKNITDTVNPEAINILWTHRMIADRIVEWTEYYWLICPSDKGIREECAKWLEYACHLNPVAPLDAASLLVRLGYKKKAVAYLQQTIAMQEKINIPDKKLMKELKNRLWEVTNDKW